MRSSVIVTHSHPTFLDQMSAFLTDMGHEIQREVHMDSSQSDSVVQRHVGGLAIGMFSLVLLFLLVSIGAIALFIHY